MDHATEGFEAPKLLLDKCDFCGRYIFLDERPIVIGPNVYCSTTCMVAARNNPDPEALAGELAEWFVPRAEEDLGDIDPITLEVFGGAFHSICLEMGNTMIRTAHSPVFYEGEDFTVAVFDPALRRVALWEGNPAQLGSLEYGVRAAITQFGFANLHDGDVIVHNNSYVGTPHLPEFCMTKPIIRNGIVVAVLANIAHHTDVGGKAPGGMPGDATDIHQEGVLIPPVKLFERGQSVEAMWRIILSNFRTPRESYGDFLAMIGSLRVAERRIDELIERYGVADVARYMKALQHYGARRMRQEIERIPNGVYGASILVGDDGVMPNRHYRIQVAVTVLDRDVLFDFRGSDVEARGPINCPYGVTVAGAINALFNLVDPALPRNQGAYDPVHFVIPRNSIVNCEYPAPLSAGNSETHNVIAECCLAALGQAVPDRLIAPSGATVSLFSGGGTATTPEGKRERFAFVQWEPIGWGGARFRDGNIGITWVGVRSRTFSTEVLETKFPWRIERYELRPDSGGAGRWRGGLGVERIYTFLGEEMTLNAVADYFYEPAHGLDGGMEGAPTDIRFIGRDGTESVATERAGGGVSPSKFSGIPLSQGEGFLIRTAGGGGLGNPRHRPPDHVLEDVYDGYVSAAKAISDYGVDADAARSAEERSWPAFRRRFLQRAGRADVART